jgi:RNA polymerase sigma-54 factor
MAMSTLSQKLDLKLGQTLVMTPQLQQAIKMLQMSNQELTDYVLTEVEQNPLLERVDPETGLAQNDGAGGAENLSGDGHTGEEKAVDSVEHDADAGRGTLDTDFENVWSGDGTQGMTDFSTRQAGGGENADEGENNWIEQTVSEKQSLRDHVMEQVQLDITDPQDRLVALILVDHLDEAGYCKADLPALAANLNIDLPRMENVLRQLQALDPAGVFARNLAECLSLQLQDIGEWTDAFQKLVANLPLLGEKAYGQLEKICGVSRAELGEMLQIIKTLNPKPALGFETDYAPTILPDVTITRASNGVWRVELNQETLPRVLVNENYFTQVKEGTADKKELDYLNDRYQTAQWLVKALHQRATTILKVATELVKQQENFFSFGLDFLKPLTLKDIATAIGMHESTVSRVTNGKYMNTPKGIFELKFFFSNGLGSSDGGAFMHAATAVKNRIKMLIEAEDARKVLSDDQLVSLLKAEGIDIARRTVAKYREAMGIGSSTERRRTKAGK